MLCNFSQNLLRRTYEIPVLFFEIQIGAPGLSFNGWTPNHLVSSRALVIKSVERALTMLVAVDTKDLTPFYISFRDTYFMAQPIYEPEGSFMSALSIEALKPKFAQVQFIFEHMNVVNDLSYIRYSLHYSTQTAQSNLQRM